MVITQFMHRVHAALIRPDSQGRPNTTTIIVINQYRDNVTAGPYENPLKEAGGWALKHGKLIDVYLYNGSKINIKQGPEYIQVGKEIRWSLLKGKAGCHEGIKGQYNFYFGERGYILGVDYIDDLLTSCIEHGVVDLSGSWLSYEGQKLGQGKDKAVDFIHQNPTLYTELQKKVMTKAGVKCILKEIW
jgi:recombination protein RecA